jgi:hypothetical protein
MTAACPSASAFVPSRASGLEECPHADTTQLTRQTPEKMPLAGQGLNVGAMNDFYQITARK